MKSGAKEVHARAACPPILFGCKYLNFSRSNSEMELIARRVIAEEEEEKTWTGPFSMIMRIPTKPLSQDGGKKSVSGWGFTSLGYNRLDDMLDAAGIDPSKMCILLERQRMTEKLRKFRGFILWK